MNSKKTQLFDRKLVRQSIIDAIKNVHRKLNGETPSCLWSISVVLLPRCYG